MKKRVAAALLTLVMALGLCACGQKAPTWEEQYDLGVRYLSEGNYQEAILAFTAAIEIDPKRPEAYVGLAQVYTTQGDMEKAAEILAQAEEACGESDVLTAAWEELGIPTKNGGENGGAVAAPEERPERVDFEDGAYCLYEYDEKGNGIHMLRYEADGTLSADIRYEYDENGNRIRALHYESDGTLRLEETFYPDGVRKTKTIYPYEDDFPRYLDYYEYDSSGRETLYDQEVSFDSGSVEKMTATYTYSGNQVNVSLEWQSPRGADVLPFSYVMKTPSNYIRVEGLSYGGSSGLDHVEVVEYALEDHDQVMYDHDGVEVARTTYHGDGRATPAA